MFSPPKVRTFGAGREERLLRARGTEAAVDIVLEFVCACAVMQDCG